VYVHDGPIEVLGRVLSTGRVFTRLPGRTHMICISNFHFCLIARHIDIVRYFIFALYTVKLQDEA
jgi:hypothetical protein